MISQYLTKYRVLISTSFLIISAISILFNLWVNYTRVTEVFNADFYKHKYDNSQWRNPESKAPIGDEDLYIYSGYRYIMGENPILISPEVPPFGKYIIGLFLITFKNHYLASLTFAVGSLIVVFFITKKITDSFLASSLAVFMSATHTLLNDQLIHSPQLDIFHLFFFLLLVLLLLLYQQSNKRLFLILSGITFGLFISTKIFLISFLIINGWLVLYYFFAKCNLKKILTDLVILNFLGLSMYALTYFQYFLQGGTPWGFLGVQKWIYTFYSQAHIDMSKLIGNYLLLIFTGNWRFWSEGYPLVSYEHWTVAWPMIFVVGVVCIYTYIKNYKQEWNNGVMLLITFLLIYNIFLLAVPMFPRYLLLLYFPLHIIIASYFAKILRV